MKYWAGFPVLYSLSTCWLSILNTAACTRRWQTPNLSCVYLSFVWSFFSNLLLVFLINSVAQSCPTLCDPMNRSRPGLPVHHQLPVSTQTHVHQVDDAIQPSHHSLLFPSPPALNLSQHRGLYQWVNSSHQVAKVLEFQLQHQSFQWTPRADLP